MKRNTLLLIAIVALATLSSCSKEKKLVSISANNTPVTAIESADGAEKVRAVLEKSRAAVDSIKAPVIGTAAVELAAYRPESPLMNFAADALRAMAQKHSDKPIDFAITNKGGLRNTIARGVITYGDVYNVFPFENTLALLTLNGEQMMELFADIARVGGEAISGARLTISPDGKLTSATINGKPVEPGASYRVATSDYLSQGNDKLFTLAKGTEREILSNITIRDLMIQYIAELHTQGKAVSATTDGRIIVK